MDGGPDREESSGRWNVRDGGREDDGADKPATEVEKRLQDSFPMT